MRHSGHVPNHRGWDSHYSEEKRLNIQRFTKFTAAYILPKCQAVSVSQKSYLWYFNMHTLRPNEIHSLKQPAR